MNTYIHNTYKHIHIHKQEHERIAIAVERAHKSDTRHESIDGKYQTVYKHYIDSRTLFEELRVASDYLAAGLMDSDTSTKFFGVRNSESEKVLQHQHIPAQAVLERQQCMCVCVHIYIYIHICIHTNIHTLM